MLTARLLGGRIRAAFTGLLRRDPARMQERYFDAFISYSHERDGRIAVALQHALHRFARPWYKLRALHVFRDDANLTANPNLWSSITSGLETARYLVLLTSPNAAASQWVNREVAHWLEHRPADRIILVLTDGELVWDDEGNTFDEGRSTALPPALSGAFQDEPRYVDLRFARGLEPLSTRNPQFREAMADIAAAIHERPKEELIGEDVRQYRRTRRIAWAAGLSLFALAVAATVAAIVALRERNRAEEQLQLAKSRGLAAEATTALSQQLPQSLLLSLEALELSDTAEAKSALFNGLLERPEIVRFMQPDAGMPAHVAFSPDGSTLAVGTTAGSIERWDAGTGELLEPLSIGERPVGPIAFSEDGQTLAAVAEFDGKVRLFDIDSGAEQSVFRAPDRPGAAESVAFADGIRTLAVAYLNEVRVWRTGSARPVAVLPTRGGDVVGMDPSARTLAVGYDDKVDIWALGPSAQRVARLDLGRDTIVSDVAFSPAADMLAVGMLTGEVEVWDARSWKKLPSPNELGAQVTDLAFSADGRALAIGTFDRRVRLWDAAQGEWLRDTLLGHIEFLNELTFAPSGLRLASAGGDNNVILWDPERADRLAQTVVRGTPRDQPLLAVDPMSERIAWIDRAGDPMLGELGGERPGESPTSLDSVDALPVTSANSTISRLEFSPNGEWLAAAIGRGFRAARTVEVWDTDTGTQDGGPLRVPAESLDFSPSGETLATAGFGKLAFSDLATGDSRVESVRGTQGQVLDYRPPDGETIAVQGRTGKVSILDAATLEEEETLRSRRNAFIFDLEFSPDGEILAGGDNDGNILLWDVTAGRLMGPPLTGHRRAVTEVEFNPDGTLLASSDSSSRMLLWDVAARRALGTSLTGATPAFSSDGGSLATWPGRGIVVRPLDLDSWRELACSFANRNLGASEWNRFLGTDTPYEPTCPGLPRGRPAEVFASAD
jgi:WD40 repeat protein